MHYSLLCYFFSSFAKLCDLTKIAFCVQWLRLHTTLWNTHRGCAVGAERLAALCFPGSDWVELCPAASLALARTVILNVHVTSLWNTLSCLVCKLSWVAILLIALRTHRVVIYHLMTLLMTFKLINCNLLKTRQLIRHGWRTVKKHMSLWNEQKMDSGAANHCAALSLGAQIKPSCKQKKEAAFCDRLAVTSCLWLYVQKQNQGLWTSHDSVSPGRPTVSGSLHAVQPGCHNTGKQLQWT